MSQALPRPVKLLGLTSLFTDAATEAIYPLLPVFVTRILGGNPASLGVIEGAADATSSVLKLLAGRWSDQSGRRKPFVVAGYGIAGFVRPLIAFASTWQHVFLVRVSDRVGKGLRGAPRDAMLGAFAPEGERGHVFGFHRAMDHAGAVVGPLLATGFLWLAPGGYRTLFGLTIVPGVIALVMLLFVPEAAVARSERSPQTAAVGSVSSLPRELKRFLVILTVFTLGNSSDAFLLLRLSDAGLATELLPLVWSGLHVVKAGLSTYGGALSDRHGRRELIISGWILYAVVYAGFAASHSLFAFLTWFLIYGVHFALVEGSEKALVSDLARNHAQGTAFGWYNAVLGFGALAASLLFGFLWQSVGPAAAFFTGAALAVAAAVILALDRSLVAAHRSGQ